MKIAMSWVNKTVELLLRTNAKRATKFVSPKEVVSVQLIGKPTKRDNIDLHVKIGRPNFEEREHIKVLQAAKEPFPVKKIKLKFKSNGQS